MEKLARKAREAADSAELDYLSELYEQAVLSGRDVEDPNVYDQMIGAASQVGLKAYNRVMAEAEATEADSKRLETVVLQRLLRQVREEAGLLHQDLAARLGESTSWVSSIERGERTIDVLELRRVCVAIGLPLSEFVDRLERDLQSDQDTHDLVN